MKKTYWWRILISAISGGVVFFGWYYDTYLCFSNYNSECMLDNYRLVVIEPTILLMASILVISPFLFFFSDKFFIKWFRFALVWFFLAIVFVALTPDQHNFMSLNPNKESVSIWMSSLFVVLSLAQFVWEWLRAKKA